MRTIITTVGTSLLTNAQRDLGLPREKPPGPTELAQYLRRTPPEKASAETNSLSRLLQEGDHIIFLRSQTEEGQRCAEALARHYENQGHPSRVVEVPDLTYTESRFKMRGLRSLVATLIEHIREEQGKGRRVLINATGGFKAEIAYATLVGLLFDVPVYYIHEAFRDIIEMPPTPIDWDYSLLADYEEFFEWISGDLRETREVDERLRGLPEEVRLLLVEEESYTLLSPAGEAFYEAYRGHKEAAARTPVWLSDAAWQTYHSAAVPPRTSRRVSDRSWRNCACGKCGPVARKASGIPIAWSTLGATRTSGSFSTMKTGKSTSANRPATAIKVTSASSSGAYGAPTTAAGNGGRDRNAHVKARVIGEILISDLALQRRRLPSSLDRASRGI